MKLGEQFKDFAASEAWIDKWKHHYVIREL